MSRLHSLVLSLIAPLALLLVWAGVRWLGWVDLSTVPSPTETFSRLVWFIGSGDLLRDFAETAARMAIALTLATFFGVALGLLAGSSVSAHAIALPVIDFVRSTPVTILYPVVVLVLGIDHSAKIALVFIGCVFVIALNTAYGVMQASETRVQMARSYGASGLQVFRWITFHDSLPQTLVGLRVALSYSLVVEILVELFMGSEYGLGQRVTIAFTTYAVDDLYALILIVGCFGFVLNRGFVAVEKRLVPWSVTEQR